MHHFNLVRVTRIFLDVNFDLDILQFLELFIFINKIDTLTFVLKCYLFPVPIDNKMISIRFRLLPVDYRLRRSLADIFCVYFKMCLVDVSFHELEFWGRHGNIRTTHEVDVTGVFVPVIDR